MKAPPTGALLCTVTLLSFQPSHIEVGAVTYNVSPYVETDSSDDATSSNGVFTVSDAFAVAQPGDTIVLEDGTYAETLDRIASVFDGEEGNPITVTGSRDAIIKAPSPSVRIENSWITLEGFTVDGEHGDTFEAESFVNKCVEVVGQGYSEDEALEGFVMKDMHVQNCGGECVRLKNFVTNSDITGNTIEKCGLYDFQFDEGNKNGEGVYVGTSTGQWADGEDRCNNNWVRGNTIETCGNECVEIKEGSSGNLVEDNVCSNQFDEKSGCYGARGDDNIIRYNSASNCEGAGVRLGGNEVDGYMYGQNNNVYGNTITDADAAALSIRVLPQGIICGNSCSGDNCVLTWNDDLGDIEETWDATCPDIEDDFNFPTTDDDMTPTVAPTVAPTVDPTVAPTVDPTVAPTVDPTVEPTVDPTVTPTVDPREDESDDDSDDDDGEVEAVDDDDSDDDDDDSDDDDDDSDDDDDDSDDDDDDSDDDDDDDDSDDDDDDDDSDDDDDDDDDSDGDDDDDDDSDDDDEKEAVDDDDSDDDDDDSDDDDDDSDDDDDDSDDDDDDDDDDSDDDDDDNDDDDDSAGDDYESDDDDSDDDDDDSDDDDDDSAGDDYESDDDDDDNDSDDDDDSYDDDDSAGDDYESDDDSDDDDDESDGDDYQSDDDSVDEGDDDSKEGRDDDGDDYQ